MEKDEFEGLHKPAVQLEAKKRNPKLPKNPKHHQTPTPHPPS